MPRQLSVPEEVAMLEEFVGSVRQATGAEQTMFALRGGEVDALHLPSPSAEAMPGVPWGRFDALFTPAYWAGQAWQHEVTGTYEPGPLGRDLPEELAACLLGGYGIPAELGLAAFERLRNLDLVRPGVTEAELERALAEPFGSGVRTARYRFPRQKARALAAALRMLPTLDAALPDRALRDALVALPGVGAKTASWVVRNLRRSDQVAIIDIHVARAGRIAGFLAPSWEPGRDYLAMEAAFLAFAEAIRVRAAVLDGLMWDHMRRLSALARQDDPARRTVRAQAA